MYLQRTRIHFLFGICLMGLYVIYSGNSFAQMLSKNREFDNRPFYAKADTFNVDKAFSDARRMAYAGQYKNAILLLSKAANHAPDYTDMKVFLARLYGWDKNYDKARSILKSILAVESNNMEANLALADIENWSGKYDQAEKHINNVLANYPNNPDFLMKKARILADSGAYKVATQLAERVIELKPNREDAKAFAEMYRVRSKYNRVGVVANVDFFSRILEPWHGYSLYYARKKQPFTYIARLNMANRFDTRGFQFESDFYKVRKKMYFFISAGFSNTQIFPRFSFSGSVFRSLKKDFEVELGLRYLQFNFDDPLTDNGVDKRINVIYFGAVSKYYKNLYFSFQPILLSQARGLSYSFTFMTRRYLKNNHNFMSLYVGTGVSPDDPSKQLLATTLPELSFQRVRLAYQHMFKSSYIVSGSIGYMYEEMQQYVFRHDYSFGIGIEKLF